jgi:hypothetical protein
MYVLLYLIIILLIISCDVVLGKDVDDEALMLEIDDTSREGQTVTRWTSFVLEEAATWTLEFADSTSTSSSSGSPFFLCMKHGGLLKYLCLSSEQSLVLSPTNPNLLAFEVIQLFEGSTENDTSTTSTTTTADTAPAITQQAREAAPYYHSGTLSKKGDDMLGSWKKRFFVARNEADNFHIDYYDKEGGVRKGSVDCSCFEVMRDPEEGKFGVLLVPSATTTTTTDTSGDATDTVSNRSHNSRDSRGSRGSSTNSTNGGVNEGKGKRGGGRTYRLRAESAESQAEWLLVLLRACDLSHPPTSNTPTSNSGSTTSSHSVEVQSSSLSPVKEEDKKSPPIPLPITLTAQRLKEESSSRSRSRSRSGSTGSLSIAIPPPPSSSSSSSSLFFCLFADGPLGMTLKRRSTGVIYIATVEEDTQASRHKLSVGDTLWSIGTKVGYYNFNHQSLLPSNYITYY